MKPLKPAIIRESETRANIEAMVNQWQRGELREHFAAADVNAARAAITTYMEDIRKNDEVYLNDVYQVNVRRHPPNNWGNHTLVHLSIRRIDRQCIHDWRDLQEIKNQLVGVECEGIEIYPAESRRVDTANQYHLWCIDDPTFRFGFGFNERLVTEDSLGKSVNRPFNQ